MMEESAMIWSVVLVAAGFVTLIVAYRAKTVWDEPGGELFSGLGVGLTLTAWFCLIGVIIGTTHRWSLLSVSSEVFILLMPVLWTAFAARRAGADWLPRRRVAWIGVIFALLMIEFRIADLIIEGDPSTSEAFNPEYHLTITIPMMLAYLGSSSLLILGIALLVKQSFEYDHLSSAPATAVSIAVIVPWLATWIGVLAADDWGTATAAVILGSGYGIGAFCFWLSYGRYNLFAASAAAGTIGRNRVIATMDDSVIVVDDASRVLDVNPEAAKLFESPVKDVAGKPISRMINEDLETVESEEVVELGTVLGRREFEPTVSTVAGPDGDLLGYSVVLRDVTERRNREQRLSVLNRVLRHNLRNEMSIVSGYAEMLIDRESTADNDQIADDIALAANELMELGEKARVIEELMAEPPTTAERTSVLEVTDEAVSTVQCRVPQCDFDVEIPDGLAVEANPRVLQPVVENLIENAVEHNDSEQPTVEIQANQEPDGEMVAITVVDNGPGIPHQERKVLESGDVSPLEHGSGLGLWVSKWGATRLGGVLSLSPREPRGTIATVRVPRSVPEASQASLASS